MLPSRLMSASSAPIHIDVSSPYRVDGQPARYQSVWLLARAWHAHRSGEGVVTAAAVRSAFPAAANLRMLVSRAFADFARWGIVVGWGADRARDPAAANPAQRSRGPFWLDAPSARRLRFVADGRTLGPVALMRHFGFHAGAHPVPPAQRDGTGYVMRDMAFWSELTQAMRSAQDGHAGAHGFAVAESFGAARRLAGDGFQQALSLLKESQAWRRCGRLDQSRAALRRFDRLAQAADAGAATPAFQAMAQVVRAWERYTRGDGEGARAGLEHLHADAELRLVVRYNPRVRFEVLNLEALLHKADAMRPGHAAAATAAQRALDAFSGALQAAYEADSVDAVQHAAANIGLSLWLFWRHGLIDGGRSLSASAVQRQAMRWLGLSEWICDRFGVGGGTAWNAIFLLRIARGSCGPDAPPLDRPASASDSMAVFRRQRPLSVADAVEALRPFHAPFAPARGFVRWSAVAAFALEDHDAGHVRLAPLQLANLLLESAWYLTHEQGATAAACAAVERLAGQLPALRPAERAFFTAELRALPPALRDAAAEAARRHRQRA
ncbi:conserved hypothetical protein [Cupriavidus taiwanensis]|uniref:Uncharacterized protein n=2 Tax=Cupriavidus taiwanensis TaxID=164546 RepID=A0A375E9D9_9BURK|nr:conserved hypothetical protein [Cupriavidus taiwanensis]SOZ65591.1 conserved hypothetical protein [Cupriavidus taiwanensis]SOZ69251.1 conserved hypothetical protein [Cupriavidus taiwanensis]SPA08430.1 conserved hypothetical protein [Cupriavidus taiwanensis]